MLATGLSLAFGVMRLVNLATAISSSRPPHVRGGDENTTGINPFLSLLVVVLLMMLLGYVSKRGLLNRAPQEQWVLPP
jgi:branched-chain amino acid transport system permease protein